MYDHSFRLDERDDSEPIEPPEVVYDPLFDDYPGCDLEPCSECHFQRKCHNLDMIGEM